MPKESAKSKKNTSKTARVLGLLTSPAPTEEGPAERPASAPRAKSEPAAPKPSDDKVVEEQVRSALESELIPPEPPRKKTAPPKPVPAEPVPAPEAPVQAKPAPEPPASPAAAPEAPVQAKPAPEPPAGPEAAPRRPRSVPIRAHPDHVPASEQDFTCFNVMQALVEAKAEKYIKLFGLCTCSRCHTDVVALSLTNLPAKYVVATSEEMVPLLSVYEGTYSAAVISQVMNSCKKVMEHPRHKLKN